MRINDTASGLPWVFRTDDDRTVLAMAQQQGISELLARILVGRGVTLDDAARFLNPSLREDLPDPFHLLGMDTAVDRIVRAINEKQPVAVFGDYDVDGATSTALLASYFAALGLPLITYIPDRMKEGYGPTVEGFKKLIEKFGEGSAAGSVVPSPSAGEWLGRGASSLSETSPPPPNPPRKGEGFPVAPPSSISPLILTVDCGTMAHEPIAYAQSQGVDVIVIDHHVSDGHLPGAYAIVNPNRADETSPHTNLAAVGVTFLLLVALNKKLRESQIVNHKVNEGQEARSVVPSPLRGGLGRGASHGRMHLRLAQEEQTLDRAQALRREPTEAEKKLWKFLRAEQFEGYKFRRQHPIDAYSVDFVCLSQRLIIELDGGQHATAQRYDAKRTAYLESQGFRVLRFWSNDVLGNMSGVLETILAQLRAPLPSPPRRGEGTTEPASPSPLNSRLSTLDSPLPNLLSYLDLVALGTVCDVMPLTGLNRAFVAQGLKVMAQRRNVGLAALADVARMDEVPNTYHLGFLLGPRINAGGRVGESGLGVELLTMADADHARAIASRLDHYNAERQAIEASVLEQAMAQAAAQENMPVILVAAEAWHEGVIGIVAGRLKEKYARPAAVVSLKDGMGKASARSVTGADIGAAIHAAHHQGLIEKGGGHAMAAGFSIAQEKIPALHEFLIARLAAAVTTYAESRLMKLDGWISCQSANLALLEDIARAAPYGIGNPSPRFGIKAARIVRCDRMKEKHLRCILMDEAGANRLTAVAFNVVGTPLGNLLETERQLHLAGELKRNTWQGKESVQFIISDAARV